MTWPVGSWPSWKANLKYFLLFGYKFQNCLPNSIKYLKVSNPYKHFLKIPYGPEKIGYGESELE